MTRDSKEKSCFNFLTFSHEKLCYVFRERFSWSYFGLLRTDSINRKIRSTGRGLFKVKCLSYNKKTPPEGATQLLAANSLTSIFNPGSRGDRLWRSLVVVGLVVGVDCNNKCGDCDTGDNRTRCAQHHSRSIVTASAILTASTVFT